jgi:hypothetical protein
MSIVFSKARRQKIQQVAATAPGVFSRETVGESCLIVPGQPGDRILHVTWRANMWVGIKVNALELILLLFGHFAVSQKIEIVTFETYHAISSRGLMKLRLYRFTALVAGVICYFIVMLAFIVLVIGIFSTASGLLGGQTDVAREDFTSGWHNLLFSVFLLGAGRIGGNAARRFGLPGSLRHIAEWPIELARWDARKP